MNEASSRSRPLLRGSRDGSPSAALQRRQPGWALPERDEQELQRHIADHSREVVACVFRPFHQRMQRPTDTRFLPTLPKQKQTAPNLRNHYRHQWDFSLWNRGRRIQKSTFPRRAVNGTCRKQLQSPHRRRRRWSPWPILTNHASIESSNVPLSACHGAIAANRRMRGTIALIVASLHCTMHSTQCVAARFRCKSGLLVTSLISLPLEICMQYLIWGQGEHWGLYLSCYHQFHDQSKLQVTSDQRFRDQW